MPFLSKKKRDKIIAELCANEIMFRTILEYNKLNSADKSGFLTHYVENQVDIIESLAGVSGLEAACETIERRMKTISPW